MDNEAKSRRGPDNPIERRGFILVAVLWILAALAALAGSYAAYTRNAAFATEVNDDQLRIRTAISSGVELAAYKLLSAPAEARPPQGAFIVRLAHSTVDVTFVSESARVDLNTAPKGLLTGLFAAVGASWSDASLFAERVVGWRSRVDNAGQNKEADAYKEGGHDYAPRQGPFQNVLELPLVLGIPSYIVDRVLPFVTVYSGSPQIDVRVAPPTVLSALPNVTPEQLQQVLALRARNPLDGEGLLKLLGSARVGGGAKAVPAARIQAQVRLDNGRASRAEVVILLQGEGEPFHILSWRDDSDGPI